jgi:CheY-like chemotaxis protein
MSRVLVVEDDPDFRALAVRQLTAWGHEIVEAGSVAEALTRATARRPDRAVVDIGLPDGNGFDLTVQLLALPWPMRVIVVSTDNSAGNQTAAQRAGAVRFFPKQDLFSVAARHLIA